MRGRCMNHGNRYRLLLSTPSGQVFHRTKGNEIMTSFGRMVLRHNFHGLVAFKRFLVELLEIQGSCDVSPRSILEIKFYPGEVTVIYSREEVASLFELVRSTIQLLENRDS